MARIKNTQKYPLDTNISINDIVIGSDGESSGKTKNFTVGSIVNLATTALTGSFSYSYKYTNLLTVSDNEGYFDITGVDEQLTNVQSFQLNEVNLNGNNLTDFFNTLLNNEENLIIKVSDGTDVKFGYFEVDSITEPDPNVFNFTVSPIGTVQTGSLVDENDYIITFNVVKDSTTDYIQNVTLDILNSEIDFSGVGSAFNGSVDLTPLFTELESPWDNIDGTPANQSSTDIKYSNGNIGIGTNDSYVLTSKLEIVNTDPTKDHFKTSNTTGGGGNVFRISGTGQIAATHIENSNFTPAGFVNRITTGAANWFQLRKNGALAINIKEDIPNLYQMASFKALDLATVDGSVSIRSTSGDGVGIGTITPTAGLEILNTDPLKPHLRVSSIAGGDGDVFEITETGEVRINNTGTTALRLTTTSITPLILNGGNNTRVRITSAGTEKAQIQTVDSGNVLTISSILGPISWRPDNVARMRLQSTGLHIGSGASPTHMFHVIEGISASSGDFDIARFQNGDFGHTEGIGRILVNNWQNTGAYFGGGDDASANAVGEIGIQQNGAKTKAIELDNTANVLINKTLFVGDTGSVDASAKAEVKSTTKGFLPPRMTGTQAEAISTPAEGLMVYSTDGSGVTITTKGWWGYDGTTWVKLN